MHTESSSHGRENAENMVVEDHYELIPHLVSIDISRNQDGDLLYRVMEPEISQEYQDFTSKLYDEMRYVMLSKPKTIIEARSRSEIFEYYLRNYEPGLRKETSDKVLYYFRRDNEGYGVINPIILDENIEDISCDGINIPIFVYHRKYGTLRTNLIFTDTDQLNSFVIKLASICDQGVSINDPILDGTSPDGHRVQAVYGTEISPRGSAFTIRLFRKNPFTVIDLVKNGTISSEMAVYLWYMVESGSSGIAVGPPAVGKTSLLNALLMFMPENSKVFSIEETRELNFIHENWIATVVREGRIDLGPDEENLSKIDTFDLVRIAMRQRPTYIVVGEVRGSETYSLFQAMSTGHTVYSTLHADSMDTLISRLESEPINVPRVLAIYLNVVIIIKFVRINNRLVRRVTEIDEIEGKEEAGNGLIYNKVFEYDPSRNVHEYNGQSNVITKLAALRKYSYEDLQNDFKKRIDLINRLAERGDSGISAVNQAIQDFGNHFHSKKGGR